MSNKKPAPTVWAYQGNYGGGNFCEDAGATTPKLYPGKFYPEGGPQGQVGWDVAIGFDNLTDLANKLEKRFGRGQIYRLAILAHGTFGEMYVSGEGADPVLTEETINKSLGPELDKIGSRTDSDTTILLMGCIAGGSRMGTSFLKALSWKWPGRTVVGFSSMGILNEYWMYRGGEGCLEPGMRDGGYVYSLDEAKWHDLKKYPWASEESPSAKVVRDGIVQKYPEDEGPPRATGHGYGLHFNEDTGKWTVEYGLDTERMEHMRELDKKLGHKTSPRPHVRAGGRRRGR